MKTIYTIILAMFLVLVSHAQNLSLEWVKQMGGDDLDIGFSISVDPGGNIYTTGYFEDTVDFDPGSGIQNLISIGSKDIFIQKLDANGNLLWVKQMGGIYDDIGLSLITDPDGNVYTTGTFRNTVDFDPGIGVQNLTATNSDVFLQKLDANGNLLWVRQFGKRGRSVTIDAFRNVYITGFFGGTEDFDPGPGVQNLTSISATDIFILKLSSSGDFIWAKQIGGSSNSDYVNHITTDIDGNVYTTGHFWGTVDFDPGPGDYKLEAISLTDIFILKLDTNGDFLWAKRMGGMYVSSGYCIINDIDGNVYTTGDFWSGVDFDPGPGIQSLISAGLDDNFIQKLDANGDFIWARQSGGNFYETSHSITINTDGHLYVTGLFSETAFFGSASNPQYLTSAGAYDIFIQKLDANGNTIWVERIGGSINDVGVSITSDAYGYIYLTGHFENTVDFDPGLNVQNLTSIGDGDIYVLKLRDGTVGLNNHDTNISFTVYPNPGNGQFFIAFEAVLNDVEVNIINALGQSIYSSRHQNTDRIALEINQPTGIYFIEIKTPEGRKTTPLILSE